MEGKAKPGPGPKVRVNIAERRVGRENLNEEKSGAQVARKIMAQSAKKNGLPLPPPKKKVRTCRRRKKGKGLKANWRN